MMAFNDIPGNSTWKTVKCDNEIVSLANGSEPDKFDQILDLLKLNKQYYLENGTTENEWLDRVSGFACQRPYVSTTNEERSKGEELGFYEDLGSPDWEASQNDSKITDLANGSESDKYDQILNILKTNKEYYLKTAVTEDQWTDRVLYFAYQRGSDVSGDPFIVDYAPVLPLDYMDSKDISWFNSDMRWEIAMKILINAIDEKGKTWYTTETAQTPDGNIAGPNDSQISSLSWLPSNCISLHNKLISSTYSKFIYIIKLSNVHLRYSEPSKIFDEIDTENTTAISNLNTSQLTDLLAYVREAYVSRPDDKTNENFEAACEMLEFDMAQ